MTKLELLSTLKALVGNTVSRSISISLAVLLWSSEIKNKSEAVAELDAEETDALTGPQGQKVASGCSTVQSDRVCCRCCVSGFWTRNIAPCRRFLRRSFGIRMNPTLPISAAPRIEYRYPGSRSLALRVHQFDRKYDPRERRWLSAVGPR